MTYELRIQLRETMGSRHARKLRHSGLVPGIVYGANKKPIMITISEREISRECNNSLFFNKVWSLLIDDKNSEKVLPKTVSYHPVTGKVLHVDFMRVSKDKKVKIMIPVEVINEDKSPGIKKGGIVNLVVHRLECLCIPDAIPEKIILDLAGKEIGDSFLLESISLPTGVEAVNTIRDSVLATIVVSKVGKDDDKSLSATTAADATTSEGTNNKSE